VRAGAIAPVRKFDLESFFSDQRVGEVDGVRDGIRVGGMHRDEFIAFAHFDFTKNLEIFARAALLADAGLLDQFDEWERAAIEDGKFEVIEFDDGVVHAQADARREQVLGGGDEHAFFH